MDRAGIAGALPECLCNMEFLQYFYVDDNAITGPIPTCIDNMTYLREFHARCNLLTGPVPTSFLELDFLRVLDVSCNSLLCTDLPGRTFLYECGDINCDQCPVEPPPVSCPESVEVPECGTYIRQM
eukprot:gnl/Dysnectes_brevis/6012_a9016_466.p1 GENE.gnl/Dysnectes_brevis/6012_a9016_466~~gnl/Dysnectes_brevis/6012_a9016_466.p1  ORF type:complete len:126 (+),score=59.11 gnl/Dysnectes_brevis/6012_a9016_466:3-380(+)